MLVFCPKVFRQYVGYSMVVQRMPCIPLFGKIEKECLLYSLKIHEIWIMYRTGYSALGHVAVKPDHRRQTNRMLVWQLRNCNVFSQIHVPRQRTKIKQDCDQHMCCLPSMLGRKSKGKGDLKNNTSDLRWLMWMINLYDKRNATHQNLG